MKFVICIVEINEFYEVEWIEFEFSYFEEVEKKWVLVFKGVLVELFVLIG